MAAAPADMAGTLSRMHIESRFHDTLLELCGAELEYLPDVRPQDLEGRVDADGEVITAPIARGLCRKLQAGAAPLEAIADAGCADSNGRGQCGAMPSVVPTTEAGGADNGSSGQGAVDESATCVSLFRCAEDGVPPTLVRCAVRGMLPHGGAQRRKILTMVLDRSGSMAGSLWRRVVDAVTGVVTDKLLTDPLVSLAVIAYSDQAQEVRLTRQVADLRELLLSREFAPQGGTSFRAAFRLTQQVIQRELKRHMAQGVGPSDVDIGTLLFTDGEDTSVKGGRGQYGVRLVDKEASSTAAREAGDAFRDALRQTGCPTYICIAAFGCDHDPDQCQYLSDRYYYINRGEVLSDVLVGGIGTMLSSAGHCSLDLELPPGVTLKEPLPATLPLDASGHIDHHVWLTMGKAREGSVEVAIAVAGKASLGAAARLCSTRTVELGSFEAHLFMLDFVALQLRQVARELCGRRPAGEELKSLRARLVDARERVRPTQCAAGAATGQLRGRAALRERLAEVEALRERLSYALGHFDEHDQDKRQIGTVAIDAILRDAGQHVPQGPTAAALARHADSLAALPGPERLSRYGKGYTTDAYSCCDAHELATQGDALFFQLHNVCLGSETSLASAESGNGLIGLEAFSLLSRNGTQAISSASGKDFTHVGLPVYATAGHFLRARMLLPGVLRHLSPDGCYTAGVSERQLLSLLGRALAAGPAKTEAQITALLHKARGVHAALAHTPSPGSSGGTLLDDVLAEATRFMEEPSARAGATDLYGIAAAGLLAEDWSASRLEELGKVVAHECMRRMVAHALRSTDEPRRLWLAWALLGSAEGDAVRGDEWLDTPLPLLGAPEACLCGGGFNPFTASEELEAGEGGVLATRPRAAGTDALLAVLSAAPVEGTPRVDEWGTLRSQLSAWGRLSEQEGGAPALRRTLDLLMTEGGEAHEGALQRAVEGLRSEPSAVGVLRSAFADELEVVETAAWACMEKSTHAGPLRLSVASALRALVDRRKAFAHAHPITGRDYPNLASHTGETVRDGWGAPAHPVDTALHHKAKLRAFRRHPRLSMSRKEALADKEYRARGGRFAFPSPLDTFIRGLHRRTQDLHEDWTSTGQGTSGDNARSAAVTEMLLRLRWDDRDERARAKLSHIVARIWDGLEGTDLAGQPPLSSALWLDDVGDAVVGAESPKGVGDAAVEAESPDNAGHAVSAAGSSDEAGNIVPEAGSLARSGSDPVFAGAKTAGYGEVSQIVAALPPGLAEEPEMRTARDGQCYTRDEFLGHYGEECGAWMWDSAPSDSMAAAVAESAGIGFATSIVAHSASGDTAAARAQSRWGPPVMDEGLQSSFDALSDGLRQRIEAFTRAARAGSRLNLPRRLRPIQRKALHVWAALHAPGVEHKSFGFASSRRLRFWVWAEGHPARDISQVRPQDLPHNAERWADDEGLEESSDAPWLSEVGGEYAECSEEEAADDEKDDESTLED